MLVRAMKRPDKSLVLLWALVIVSIVLSAAGLRAVIFRQQSGQAPGFLLGHKGRTKNAGAEGPSHATVKVAGSGTNLPITKILAREFKMADPAVPVVVYDSIGSRGAVRALGDGVIDVGLVSRRLKESERREDFEIIPYARTLAAIGVNASVREDDITSRDLVAIYEGKKTKWMDGSPIVVLQREASDSTNEILFRIFPAFKKANEAAYGHNRWRVLFTDGDMLEALEDTEGAIGPTDTGAVAAGGLSIKVLGIDGVAPSPENAGNGSYPFVKDLSFVVRKGSGADVRKFVDFCMSEKGKEIILRHGYLLAAP
jgi:phosphate transport system substrate-binding protein